jgi:hypothetical protein
VEQDKVFGIVSSLGTEDYKAVYKYLEEKRVPDMFIQVGEAVFVAALTLIVGQ